MRPSRVTFVVLLALVGVVLAAGITYAASRLVSQPIGLASEPHDLSSTLVAPAVRTSPTRTTPAATTTTAPVTTAPTTTAPSAVPEHSGGDGHDHDGDDD